MGDNARALTVRTTVSWTIAAVLLVALFATGFALTSMDPSGPATLPRFTATPAWSITAPLAAASVFAIAAWNRWRGDRVLARWFLASAFSIGVYHLGGELGGWLERNGSTGTWAFALGTFLTFAGWTLVLAILQASAVTAGERALGERWGRGLRLFVMVSIGLVVIVNVVIRDAKTIAQFPDMPLILPVELDTAPAAQVALTLSGLLWMVSLIVVPLLVWIAVARARGIRRQTLARIAIGTLLPALVIMLCGVLGLSAGGGDLMLELSGLAVGFGIAAPVTAIWLTATVRDATMPGGAALTTVTRVSSVLLWLFYLLGVVQVGGWVTATMGTTTGRAIVVTTLIAAATAVPWRLFVRWCTRRIDPRQNLAAMIVARRGEATTGDPARLAQTALREALSDPDARLLIATARGWIDVDGEIIVGPGDQLDQDVVIAEDSDGQPIGALIHRTRFIDVPALLVTVRPLIERAALDAELRDRAERIDAERRRADAAADEARRRIERDLHDGVQGRLVSLGLGLSLARAEVDDPVTRLVLDDAVSGLQTAVLELRELAAGTLSQTLTTRGLASAVGELVARMPLDIELRVDDASLDPRTEAVAYFVIAEGVTNAVKHAGAARITVAVTKSEGSVSVTIGDEGPGGADLRAGTGLRGLRERVRSVGGRLVVSDRDPHGTLVEAVLPCES